MSAHFFITGTDTGVGKTYFTSWLVRRWRKAGLTGVGLKPIACGDRDDAVSLQAAAGHALTLDEINPVFFSRAAAPLLAAAKEGQVLDFSRVNHHLAGLRVRFPWVAIEGVGGWRAPLAPNYEARDWVRELQVPVLVVAQSKLGVLNHTLLTVESIQAARLICAGIVLNDYSPVPSDSAQEALHDHQTVLEATLGLPVFRFDHTARTVGQLPVAWGGE